VNKTFNRYLWTVASALMLAGAVIFALNLETVVLPAPGESNEAAYARGTYKPNLSDFPELLTPSQTPTPAATPGEDAVQLPHLGGGYYASVQKTPGGHTAIFVLVPEPCRAQTAALDACLNEAVALTLGVTPASLERLPAPIISWQFAVGPDRGIAMLWQYEGERLGFVLAKLGTPDRRTYHGLLAGTGKDLPHESPPRRLYPLRS
jgi:hypothetical protein